MNEITVLVLKSAIGDAESRIQWEAFETRVKGETSFVLKRVENPADADFVFLSTGGVEQFYADHYREMPRAIFAPRMTNAYAAMNEIRGFLAKHGARVFCSGDMGVGLDEFLRIARARRLIREAKITMFGAPAPWLVASFPSRDLLRAKFGISLEPVPWEALHWASVQLPQAFEKKWQDYPSSGVNGGDLRRACQLSFALLDWVRDNGVDAVMVGCFPLLSQHVSACLAVSDLLDDGIAAACENDICSVMAMLTAMNLGACEIPPWMANLVDIQGDTITLQHCTIGKRGLKACQVMTHFESGANAAVAGTLGRNEPVTVFRFDESFDQACIVEGVVTESGPNPLGCRTSATIRLDGPFPTPLGNHHILLSGHLGHILRGFCRMMGISS